MPVSSKTIKTLKNRAVLYKKHHLISHSEALNIMSKRSGLAAWPVVMKNFNLHSQTSINLLKDVSPTRPDFSGVINVLQYCDDDDALNEAFEILDVYQNEQSPPSAISVATGRYVKNDDPWGEFVKHFTSSNIREIFDVTSAVKMDWLSKRLHFIEAITASRASYEEDILFHHGEKVPTCLNWLGMVSMISEYDEGSVVDDDLLGRGELMLAKSFDGISFNTHHHWSSFIICLPADACFDLRWTDIPYLTPVFGLNHVFGDEFGKSPSHYRHFVVNPYSHNFGSLGDLFGALESVIKFWPASFVKAGRLYEASEFDLGMSVIV